MDAGSLLALPDGTPILPGDSVLIQVSVVDPTEMLFDLEPTGLKFNPAAPARLKIHYDHAGGDLNDDGVADGRRHLDREHARHLASGEPRPIRSCGSPRC